MEKDDPGAAGLQVPTPPEPTPKQVIETVTRIVDFAHKLLHSPRARRVIDRVAGEAICEEVQPAKPKPALPRQTQQRLPGTGVKAATVKFDRKVVRIIRSNQDKGTRVGELKAKLVCSRGQIRLSLERCKAAGRIRQEGVQGGARYYVTDSGEAFASEKS